MAQVRTSVTSGNWTTPSTWDCNCVPANTEDAVIATGTTVTQTADITINNLTIQVNGILDNAKKLDNVGGNLVVDGTLSGKGDINLNGTNTTISGTGSIADAKKLFINNGNQTILKNTNLNLPKADIIINGAFTVTNKGMITLVKKLIGNSNNSTWVNDTNATLLAGRDVLVTGILVASAPGNTVEYNRNKNQNIKMPQGGQYYNLTVSGGGTKTMPGTLDINGNLTINYSILDFNGADVLLAGDYYTAYGTAFMGTRSITFDGTGNQSVNGSSASSFYDVIVNKTGGVLNWQQSDTVTNQLSLTSGVVSTASGKKVIVGTSAANPGIMVSTGGYVEGFIEKWVTTTALPYIYPLGAQSFYRPAAITFSALSSGTVTFGFVPSFPGNNGLPLLDTPDSVFNTFNEGYWQMTSANGFGSATYNLSLDGNGFTSYTINPSTRLLSRTAGGPWQANGTHVAASGVTANRNGLVLSNADFAFGDTASCRNTPAPLTVVGSDSVCTGDIGEVYSVTLSPGSVYQWTVSGGTQSSGGNGNSITVDWGSTGMNGSVIAQEYNGCAYGAPDTLAVAIHTVPASAINGSTDVASGATETYSVTGLTGYTYNWTVTGGTITTGQGTASISVSWGTTPGSGSVQVIASTGCGNAPPTQVSVNIYSVINSIASGDWATPSTWDCNCVPAKSANVRINSGHVITSTVQRAECNHFEIAAGGVFNNTGQRTRINGNLTINGSFMGNNRLEIRGSSNTIDGTGTFIGFSGEMRIKNGVNTIASTAVLRMYGGFVTVDKNTVVLNQGDFTSDVNIDGRNVTTSTWINDAGARLTAGAVLMATGHLDASAQGNTVNYNGTANQNIKTPDQSIYYHLQLTGGGIKSMQAPLDINGNVLISSTFDCVSNNINLAGDWTNTGTFTAGTSLITFDGSAIQNITNTLGENFNNATVNAGSSIRILPGSDAAVNGIFTNNGTTDNDGILRLPGGYSVQSGTLRGSGEHILSGGNWDLSTGTFMADSGTVSFTAAVAQTITGAATFYNITCNNAAGVSVLSGAQGLRNNLNPLAGTFNTANLLTVLSDAGGTGRITAIQAGADVIGNIRMQRYIPAAPTSWRFLSSACSGQTLADWNDDLVTSGFPGSDFPSFPFTSVYRYDETDPTPDRNAATSYIAPTNITDPILNEGYWVYIGPVPLTFDTYGPANKFAQNLNVSYTSSGMPSEDGWCLVANPYPCPIDWDAVSGWTKTNMNNEISIWNPANQQYAQYIGGVGINGGSQYIASQQSFYVHANAVGAALSATEAVKAAVNPSYFRMSNYDDVAADLNLIKMKLSTAGKSDETAVIFRGRATLAHDRDYDAIKMPSFEEDLPYIASVSEDADYAINALPAGSIMLVPIRVRSPRGENTVFTFSKVQLPGYDCVVLEDTKTGISYPVDDGTSFSFKMNSSEATERFLLHARRLVAIHATDNRCHNTNDGMAVATVEDGAVANLNWYDASGHLLRHTVMGQDTLKDLSPGAYYILAESSSVACGSGKRNFEIKAPDALQMQLDEIAPSAGDKADGVLNINVTGGTYPYQYTLNDVTVGSEVSGIKSGDYDLVVTDARGCYLRDHLFLDAAAGTDKTTQNEINAGTPSADVSVYPNPARSYLNITLPTGIKDIALFDGTGRLLLRKTITADQVVLDLESYPVGLYMLHISGTDVERTVKVAHL